MNVNARVKASLAVPSAMMAMGPLSVEPAGELGLWRVTGCGGTVAGTAAGAGSVWASREILSIGANK